MIFPQPISFEHSSPYTH